MISRRKLFAGIAALFVSPKLASGGVIPAGRALWPNPGMPLPFVFGKLPGGHIGLITVGEVRALNDGLLRGPICAGIIDGGQNEVMHHLLFDGPIEVEDVLINGVPLAQMDRASDSGSEGQEFESPGDHQFMHFAT